MLCVYHKFENKWIILSPYRFSPCFAITASEATTGTIIHYNSRELLTQIICSQIKRSFEWNYGQPRKDLFDRTDAVYEMVDWLRLNRELFRAFSKGMSLPLNRVPSEGTGGDRNSWRKAFEFSGIKLLQNDSNGLHWLDWQHFRLIGIDHKTIILHVICISFNREIILF